MSIHALKPLEPPRWSNGRLLGDGDGFGPLLRLGQILCLDDRLSPHDLVRALAIQAREDVPLGVILRAHGLVSARDLLEALAQQAGLPTLDLDNFPPDAALLGGVSPLVCLKHGALPVRRHRDGTLVVLSNPAELPEVASALPAALGPFYFALAPEAMVERHIAAQFARDLSRRADLKCPARFSCRAWARPVGRGALFGAAVLLGGLVMALPVASMWLLYAWVVLNLLAMSILRVVALIQTVHARRSAVVASPVAPPATSPMLSPAALLETPSGAPDPGQWGARSPRVTVLVPVYREDAILPRLIKRLTAITYPKELLDICLVLEEGDDKTLDALACIDLPHWMRWVSAPKSRIKTKPRAMNYALDFCRGEIIGIYDAEDAPEPDQITRVVRKFRESGPEVACVQAYLDYYNPRENWLSRCFTIEYAIWFRVILQAVEHMRLPVPLGGTSVFFRREALEKLGGWDAHNVTEDADLGMRLARQGYRCAFEPSTTHEEANCRTLPWIKQRSRWLKGYAMTWITHMRAPRLLWRELGPQGFLTFQVILLGTLSNFLLAPAIWSFWLVGFGYTPFFYTLLPRAAWALLGTMFVSAEVIQVLLGVLATSGRAHRHLLPWVPTMMFYWPLGSLAAYKAIYEVLTAPFYWDKTRHGVSQAQKGAPALAAAAERPSTVGLDLAGVQFQAGLKSK